ncbi:T9SS type A sorting domain-containing protein [Candidatus Kapabacteria bacterium]|nr:T9SS type A sorting domain-containing protein [Candidatus Kapabacteria bacterium]
MQGITTKTLNMSKVAIFAALMFAFFGTPTNTNAQPYLYPSGVNNIPKIPVLSLTGDMSDYVEEWYPDAEILVPPNTNGKKIIYVPVFIQNEWEQKNTFVNPDIDEFDADPITNFEFSLLYHTGALKPIGLTTDHPELFTITEKPMTDELCDAKDWHLSYSMEETDEYKSLVQTPSQIDERYGKRLRISGVSPNKPLPVHSDFRILLYVMFEMVPNYKAGFEPGAQESALIIHNDEIRYNDFDVTDESPFLEYSDYLTSIGSDINNFYVTANWPKVKNTFDNTDPNQPQPFTPGIGGIENWSLNNSSGFPDPIMPGMIYVKIMPLLVPQFRFSVEGRPVPQVLPTGQMQLFGESLVYEYTLVDPITDIACTTNPSNELPTREIILENTVSGTRIENVVIETSAEWLEVETNRQKGLDFVPDRTRFDVIDYVDNGTLSDQAVTVLKESPKGDGGKIILDVTCDPSKLPTDPEFEGVYEAYITVKSDNALNNPCRLKVTFIYYRAPQEGQGVAGTDCGVNLVVENSNSPVESASLVFGTADRATDGIDPLFGEEAYGTGITGFGARFYLKDRFDQDIITPNPAPNGLSDLAPNDENRAYDSRDIRSIDANTESIIYHVKFNENGDNNYPITVSWNIKDFIDGAQYFIRDVINGTSESRLFPSVNMRTANDPINDNSNDIRTFTITDQRVNEFVIEYTLSDVVDYVDANGDPIIKEGWNFLSLPVKPVNTAWNNIYPNAINEPIYFVPNTYLSEEDLRVGRGYFIKYSNQVDTRFAGSSISEISRDLQDSTRVYPGENGNGGWNTIGALSVPACIEGISFDAFGTEEPDPDYTRKFGVWRYNTRAGYEEVSELLPGLGYFIKVNENGYYKLETSNCKSTPAEVAARDNIYSNSELIRVNDASDNSGKVYISRDGNVNAKSFEMPPKPPVQVFDARFNTNTKLVNTDESILNLQGVTYPVSLEINYAAANYEFTDALTGRVLGTIKKGENKTIEIEQTATNSIKINYDIPEFTGHVNVYPNPVDDFMAVDYKTNNEGNVNISLYSMVGLKVADLFNGYQSAGTHNLSVDGGVFNLNQLAEGRYILKITTVDGDITAMVNVLRK